MSKIIKRVSDQNANRFTDHFNFPQNEVKWTAVRQNCYHIAGIPAGIGDCIDCTHINVQNPSGLNGKVFRNLIR